jgi:hypothetical protein
VEWSEFSSVSGVETGDSQRGREAVNAEVEGYTALEAVISQRLVKTRQTEKTEYLL